MDPDKTARLTLQNVDLVARWSGIDGARADQTIPQSVLFSLLGLFRAERVIGILLEADFSVVLANWQAQPAPAALSHVINQVDDEEVDHLDAAAVNNAYRAYKQQWFSTG